MSQLPTYDLSLQSAQTSDDPASLAITHNINMTELTEYIMAIKSRVATMSSNGSITAEQFNTLLDANKKQVTILAGMADEQTIDFNDYQLRRVTAGSNSLVEFRITDTDTDRATDFRKTLVAVSNSLGERVNPIIAATATWLSIQFNNNVDVAASQSDQATDPNNKLITFI